MLFKIRTQLIVAVLSLFLCLFGVCCVYYASCYISMIIHEKKARDSRFQFHVPLANSKAENNRKNYFEALLPKGTYKLIIIVSQENEDCKQIIISKIMERHKNGFVDISANETNTYIQATDRYYVQDFTIANRETLCAFEIVLENRVCKAKVDVFIATYDPFYKGNIPEK